MNKEERLEKIAKLKTDIDDLRKIKSNIINTQTENIRINIETKRWYGYGPDIHFGKIKDNIYISKELANEILDEMIKSKIKQADELIIGGRDD